MPPVRGVSLERQSGARLSMAPKAERTSFSAVVDVLAQDRAKSIL